MNDLVPALRELIREILTENVTLIISVAIIIAALFLVWLLLRGVRLWYWKVNDSTGTLKKIEKRLNNVEKYMAKENRKKGTRQTAMPSKEQAERTSQPSFADTPAAAIAAAPDAGIGSDAKAAPASFPEASEAVASQRQDGQERPDLTETFIGKSGRIYRRDELEDLIRN